MRSICFLLALWAAPAVAEGWSLKGDDTPLSHADMEQRFVGKILTFYDDGEARFGENGQYSYTYADGGAALGSYELGAQGEVCIAYTNGFSRCDLYVQNKGRLVMLTNRGERFPIRP